MKPWEKCKIHGPALERVWACPTCLVELRTQRGRMFELLDEAQHLMEHGVSNWHEPLEWVEKYAQLKRDIGKTRDGN